MPLTTSALRRLAILDFCRRIRGWLTWRAGHRPTFAQRVQNPSNHGA